MTTIRNEIDIILNKNQKEINCAGHWKWIEEEGEKNGKEKTVNIFVYYYK